MDILSRDELIQLTQMPRQTSVSIYMPSHRTVEIEQDPIRLRNLLRKAEEQLVESGVRSTVASDILEAAQRLLSDGLFWRNQGDGLALFLAPDLFRHYRLPSSFQELVVVAERFHIKPLLPLLSGDGLFYVLAVSQNQVRLIQCSRDSLRTVTPDSVPESLAETLKYDNPERQLQFHTGTGTGPGKRRAMFHGHGVGMEDTKDNILRYFQQIDRGLREVLQNERAPLVVAGVDYLHSIYRQANSYTYLLGEGIEGNPDGLSAEDLQKQAWTIVEPYHKRGQAEALDRYCATAGTGLATNDVEQALLAAYDGRISTLLVALEVQQWGSFDAEKRSVRLHQQPEPGDDDLLDFTAAYTLAKAGTVYAVEASEVPDGSPVAAVFRY